MVKKVRVPKWKPKRLWTPRQLAELSAEIEKLKQNVRAAEAARSRTSLLGVRGLTPPPARGEPAAPVKSPTWTFGQPPRPTESGRPRRVV